MNCPHTYNAGCGCHACKDDEIATLKAEVARLESDKLLMRDVCEGQSGSISDLQRQAKVEVLREVLANPVKESALLRGAKAVQSNWYKAIEEKLKQLEADR